MKRFRLVFAILSVLAIIGLVAACSNASTSPTLRTVPARTVTPSTDVPASAGTATTPSTSLISPASTTTAPSPFRVDNLAVNPAEVNPGVQTLITVKVTNTGSTEATYSGKVKIDSVTKSTLPTYLSPETITVAPGSTQILSVVTSIRNPGTYQVTWDTISKVLVVNAETQVKAGSIQNSQPTPAPDFKAVDVVTGKTISLSQFKGKPVLLNFVNYGCDPSLNNVVSAQLLAIKRVYEQRQDFVPVSVFCGCCPPEVLRQFAKDNGLNWPWILDSDNAIVTKYISYLRKYGYPTLIFIDKDMLITDVSGAATQAVLTQKLDSLNATGAPVQ